MAILLVPARERKQGDEREREKAKGRRGQRKGEEGDGPGVADVWLRHGEAGPARKQGDEEVGASRAARGRAAAARGGPKQRRLEAGRSRARGTELRCKINDGRRVLCSLREKRRERSKVTGETGEGGSRRRRIREGLAWSWITGGATCWGQRHMNWRGSVGLEHRLVVVGPIWKTRRKEAASVGGLDREGAATLVGEEGIWEDGGWLWVIPMKRVAAADEGIWWMGQAS